MLQQKWPKISGLKVSIIERLHCMCHNIISASIATNNKINTVYNIFVTDIHRIY